jgi:hypothetical protein
MTCCSMTMMMNTLHIHKYYNECREIDKKADSTGVTVSVMDHNLVASNAFMVGPALPKHFFGRN